jgi:hypothetical protein
MKRDQEFNDEFLREHFKTEMFEKAPDGFTERVMNMVNMEAASIKVTKKHRTRSLVPLVSLVIMVILIVVTLFFPASETNPGSITWMKLAGYINLTSKIDLDNLFRFSLPGYLPYLIISIFFLSIFDVVLNGLFHREKK